ncbi:hypothetical protein KVT40_003423 [Elsinoe batatas]|uniref:Uncharacterized protein n=1 Tax=Elsinoe batatas TaxID=2601811 RepID=A0A8K0LC86_9PEZI|nr:hypothetical protein KVT40_003423 [Elsinoe batatas]
MSFDTPAALRKGLSKDLAKLADEHYRHDLEQSDRDAIQSAAKRLSTATTIGSIIGLSLGVYSAFRLRRNRLNMFNAFKAAEKPVEVKFANGRTESLPDFTPHLKPTTAGDVATYTFFGLGGMLLGGELGLLLGGVAAKRSVNRNPDSRKRIEDAFRKFRVEALRKQAGILEQGRGGLGL